MNLQEQEALLLRQVAGLRRRGLDHQRALQLASESLPQGPLRDRVQIAQRTLSAGGSRDDPLQGLLASGTSSVQQLDHAAAALEARLWAQASLHTTRLYLSVAVAGPLLLCCLLAWAIAPFPEALNELPDSGGPTLGLAALMRWAGVPLAVTALLLLQRFIQNLAPGFRQATQAAGLLEMAAQDGDEPPVALMPTDEQFFLARRERIGARAAAAELAEELSRSSSEALLLFRRLAPVLGTMLVIPALACALIVLGLPYFAFLASSGLY